MPKTRPSPMRPLGYPIVALPTFQLLWITVERATRCLRSSRMLCIVETHNQVAGDRNPHWKPTVAITLPKSAFLVETHCFSLVLRQNRPETGLPSSANCTPKYTKQRKKREKVQTEGKVFETKNFVLLQINFLRSKSKPKRRKEERTQYLLKASEDSRSQYHQLH